MKFFLFSWETICRNGDWLGIWPQICQLPRSCVLSVSLVPLPALAVLPRGHSQKLPSRPPFGLFPVAGPERQLSANGRPGHSSLLLEGSDCSILVLVLPWKTRSSPSAAEPTSSASFSRQSSPPEDPLLA